MKPNDHGTDVYYDPTQDLEKLRKKLVFFQGLVVDGEAKRLADPGVDEWMDDINDLVYDVEDIFDDIKSLRKDQVSVNYSLLKESSDCIKDRLGKILDRTDELVGSSKDLDLQRRGGRAFPGDSKVILRIPETSSVVDISEIHGREQDKTVIVKRLLEVDDAKRKQNYDVLCIVGMGGLGKTTLAQLVFNDPEVLKHFHVRRWVCISNFFDVKGATKELIENSGDGGSLDNLQTRLNKMVENKRFLFVLDDLWSSSEWDKMKTPFNSCLNGSKILVTTRNILIAHALGNTNPYQLQELNHKKCMEIFRDRAFGIDEGEQEKVDLVEVIVRACKGVPLVVKVIGSMLRVAGVEKWRHVSKNTATWDIKNNEILPAIRLSYYDLPASLKRCFEYMAVFPPDYEFEQDDVVALWIADGLVQEEEGRRAEDIGNEYYNELKGRSLIQENNMMHDIVHHLASVLSRKFCYMENSKEPAASVRHAFVVELKAKHYEFLAQAPCLRTLIVENLEDTNNFRNTIRSCKMLRTFTICPRQNQRAITGFIQKYPGVISERDCLSLGESFVDHLTYHIRYLTIVYSDIRHLPDSVCMLSNLQFLNLCGNPFLKNLPDTVNHLSNLRFLCVANSSILSLPDSFCALSQLQVLNLCGCDSLKELPKDIWNLRGLQTLDLTHTSISILPDSICALSQLQVLNLRICQSLKELPKDIGNLRSLQTLDLSLTSISSFPDSMCALSKLQVLKLQGCWLPIELPKDIGNLRSLEELDLKGTFISSLPDSICALSQLQVLVLINCHGLQELPKDIGNLRSIQTLDLQNTEILSVPESISNLTGLKNLLLNEHQQLPLHMGRLARSLKALPEYNVGKQVGRCLRELNLMNRLEGSLKINNMENVGGVEEAKMADLKSKKNVTDLEFCWSQPGNVEEMEVKIMEALEPHHALECLTFTNYGCDKFPAWIMSSNVCLSNLINLKMEGLNKIREMIEMEFVLLENLCIVNCPRLRKVLMATPKLDSLCIMNCGELEGNCVHLLPSLSDKAGMHSIVSQLEDLECDYNIFEYFFEMLKTTNLKWDNLYTIRLSARGRRVASLPDGWPTIMECLESMHIDDIAAENFQFLPDGDQIAFPPLYDLYINNCEIERPFRHSYTITLDGIVEREEESEEVEEAEEIEEESEEEESEGVENEEGRGRK